MSNDHLHQQVRSNSVLNMWVKINALKIFKELIKKRAN